MKNLLAAFTTDDAGRKILVQDVESADELRDRIAERDTWSFWLVTLNGQRFVEQRMGGLFMSREQAADEYWKTETFARFIREATW